MTRRFLSALGIFLLIHNLSVGQRKEEFRSYFRIANVAYTENKLAKSHQLDVYMPKKGSKSPVIIWVHDGNWISGDKSDVDKKPEYFTSKGYIFIAINHRLSPESSYIGQAHDVATSVVWVYNNILHYSGDKNKIFLMGHGTGAHLAMLVSLQSKYLKNASGSVDMLKGVVAFEGVGFDIPKVMSAQGKNFKEGCQTAIGNSRRQWIEASPVTHIKPGIKAPPFLVAYAEDDNKNDSEALTAKLIQQDFNTKIKSYPNKSSQSIYRELGREGDKVTEDIMAFFYECLQLKASY